MNTTKHKHVGLWDPREVAFAKKWREDNELGHTLEYLLSETPNERDGVVTDRDREVAATVIQWLGSTVGMCFLRDVIDSCPEIRKWFKTLVRH